MFNSCLVVTVLFLQSYMLAQQQPAAMNRAQRADRIQSLAGQVLITTKEDQLRVTKDYVETRISQIRDTVRDQILETLAEGDDVAKVREAVQIVLSGAVDSRDNPGSPFVYASNLQGIKTVVIGYNVLHGGSGIPNSKVVIQGYRKSGLTYEFADEAGSSMDNCGLSLNQLNSPRSNEAWFLAHGHVYGFMGHEEAIRVYSFDGYRFKELWASPSARILPDYNITPGMVTITYEERGAEIRSVRDTILLTSGGPVVSTGVVADK